VRRLGLCVAVSLLTACTADSGQDPPGSSPIDTALAANATVVRVVDGDTIVAAVDGRVEHVRLIGIDTPETVREGSPVECFGPESSAFTRGLLPTGTAVRLERDVEARDDYDRLLAYVFRAGDGAFVNLAIVRAGNATPLPFPPNLTHAAEFVRAARSAEEEGLGLWGACR
jgi:micrococcal nuclease